MALEKPRAYVMPPANPPDIQKAKIMEIELNNTVTADAIGPATQAVSSAGEGTYYGNRCTPVAESEALKMIAYNLKHYGKPPIAVSYKEIITPPTEFLQALIRAQSETLATQETVQLLGMGGEPRLCEAAGIALERINALAAARQGGE